MKKTGFYFGVGAMAVVLAFAACKKEEDTPGTFRLRVQPFVSEHKTVMTADNYTMWEAGDAVYYNGGNTVAVEAGEDYWKITLSEDVGEGDLYTFYGGNSGYVSYDAEERCFSYAMPASFAYSGQASIKAPLVGRDAVSSDGRRYIEFTNACPLLKLTFASGTPTQVEVFETLKAGNASASVPALSGTCTATYGDGGWEFGSPTSTGDDTCITVTGINASTVYIPIPQGRHQLRLRYTVGGQVITKTMKWVYEMRAGHVYTITDNVRSGNFTVNAAGKQVVFSMGNLLYDNGTWQFSEHQYTHMTSNDYTSSDGTKFDLFFRSNTYDGNTYGATLRYKPDASNDGSYTFKDWGEAVNHSGNAEGADGEEYDYGWYTLTLAEWQYLFNSRVEAGVVAHSYSRSAINGTVGIILYPDGFDFSNWPSGAGLMPGAFDAAMGGTSSWKCNGGQYSSGTSSNAIGFSVEQWNVLENLGCTFLPAEGYRNNGSRNSTSIPSGIVSDYGTAGFFWAAADNHGTDTTARRLKFTYSNLYFEVPSATTGFSTNTDCKSSTGCAVRLVRTVPSK